MLGWNRSLNSAPSAARTIRSTEAGLAARKRLLRAINAYETGPAGLLGRMEFLRDDFDADELRNAIHRLQRRA